MAAIEARGPENATQDVAIIGAGLAGLCMAIELKRAGTNAFTVFEKASDIGGVWRENRYPGAACDSPSQLYSYSFEPHNRSTRRYASQSEILGYLKRCARKHGIESHLKLGTEITHVSFDSDAQVWRLRSASGDEHRARAVVTASGQLSHPSLPSIAGRDEFTGRAFHSAQWDANHDLGGRTVAVIGNGCSSVQIVPQIAPSVKQLYVFQRSAKWILPKWDRQFGPVARSLFRRFTWSQKLGRVTWFLLAELIAYSPFRGGLFRRAWTAVARLHLRRQIADPELRSKLTPSFPFGCNRLIFSNDYYPALARNNVELVTEGIARMVPNGVETSDGRVREVDTIIYATGFQSTRFLAPMEIRGPGGLLSDVWRDGASAYLGIALPGFPNLFILGGPNTSPTNNSIIYMIESQVRYVIGCLEMIRKGGAIEVRPDVFAEYQQNMRSWLKDTVWNGECRSWYKTESGLITNPWPLRAYRYRWATRRPSPAHFVVSTPNCWKRAQPAARGRHRSARPGTERTSEIARGALKTWPA
jgi:cation diffusion facilitator CzcD-associated flavoprotein CzcO